MRPPTALSIAGSDSSGGAGIQADVKTFTTCGVYGASAITSLTAQNTQGVQGVVPVSAADVRAQILSVIDDLPIDATKFGMLGDPDVVNTVADTIAERRSEFGTTVVDPVLVATSGDVLTSDDAATAMRERLVPLADVLTPNLPEAARLCGEAIATTEQEMIAQGHTLRKLGATLVVIKGSHLAEETQGSAPENITDIVVHADGVERLSSPRVETRNTHGTGCTLSSAIAACAARQKNETGSVNLFESVTQGRAYLVEALQAGAEWELSYSPATGHGPVNHLWDIQK